MKVYNLSYDQSKKLPEGKNPLERKELLDILISSEIIDLNAKFRITDAFDRVTDNPFVVYPVKTTIVFHSQKNREDILPTLRQLSDRMFYILTEVHQDEDLYLGSLHGNEELQQECSKEIQEILDARN